MDYFLPNLMMYITDNWQCLNQFACNDHKTKCAKYDDVCNGLSNCGGRDGKDAQSCTLKNVLSDK